MGPEAEGVHMFTIVGFVNNELRLADIVISYADVCIV
jgi:hypothetical protein